MHHIAIMKKSWGLIPKIQDGRKTIESRWYMHKYAPWGKIENGDTIYFKNSGEPVTLKVQVDKVLSFDNLTPNKVHNLLEKYGKKDGIEERDLPVFYERFKDKKYCLLIYLKDVKQTKPFEIDKTGFGAMAAWICVENISQLFYIT